jgi:hypothetical protein
MLNALQLEHAEPAFAEHLPVPKRMLVLLYLLQGREPFSC